MYSTITKALSTHPSLTLSLGNQAVPGESSSSHVQAKTRVLSETIKDYSSIPLSNEEEMFIHKRIEVLLQQSANEKIINLIMAIQSNETLSAANKQTIDKWIREFFEIDPFDKEAQSLALAYLTIKVLDPALLTEEENEQLLIMEWRENCEEILPLFLQGEPVDCFLEECEYYFIQENLLKNICLRADETLKILSQAFEQTLESKSKKILDAYQLLKQKLITVKEIRQEDFQSVANRIDLLIHEIEGLTQLIIDSDLENAKSLCQELAVHEIQFHQDLEKCQSFIKGFYEHQ